MGGRGCRGLIGLTGFEEAYGVGWSSVGAWWEEEAWCGALPVGQKKQTAQGRCPNHAPNHFLTFAGRALKPTGCHLSLCSAYQIPLEYQG